MLLNDANFKSHYSAIEYLTIKDNILLCVLLIPPKCIIDLPC